MRALRWLALPLALSVTHVVCEDHADAKPKKTKKKKKTGPSMDDNAGRDVDEGGTAPGTTDSKSTEVEVVDQTPKKKPKPGESEPEEVTLEESDAPTEPAVPEPPPPYALNWLSFVIQQDFLVYGSTPDVCPSVDSNGKEYVGNAAYSCRDSQGVYRGNVYNGAGNEVHGGFGLATFRLGLGYDRVLGSRLALGARVSFMLLQAPAVTGSKRALPVSGEAHIAYYFGDSPFERQGIRPYAAFAVGIAEVQGKVSVAYYKDHIGYQQGKQGTLDAWRSTGPGFVALSPGASLPFGNFMLSAELRAQVMLGHGSAAFAPGVAVGLAYGL